MRTVPETIETSKATDILINMGFKCIRHQITRIPTEEGRQAREEWQNEVVRRDSALIKLAAELFMLSDEEVDDIFILAALPDYVSGRRPNVHRLSVDRISA